ncbi:atg16-like protein [Zygosaccharomyces mellis]|uniref:Atg16-like protein n=1 Tax=Zygosaccharomyces mellis TaxID=42258 RepID=A0A4C2E843_9SACH|nr:atg16-like protein [Zygosaccharomyces mellis]
MLNPKPKRMDLELLERLQQRDKVESRFQELFIELKPSPESDFVAELNDNGTLTVTLTRLRKELKGKELQISSLREIINVKNKDFEKLNDEIISLSIENNLLQKRFRDLEEEHNKLVKRWLDKVQQDVEKLNANLQ